MRINHSFGSTSETIEIPAGVRSIVFNGSLTIPAGSFPRDIIRPLVGLRAGAAPPRYNIATATIGGNGQLRLEWGLKEGQKPSAPGQVPGDNVGLGKMPTGATVPLRLEWSGSGATSLVAEALTVTAAVGDAGFPHGGLVILGMIYKPLGELIDDELGNKVGLMDDYRPLFGGRLTGELIFDGAVSEPPVIVPGDRPSAEEARAAWRVLTRFMGA